MTTDEARRALGIRLREATEKLAKWRAVFAGWQLGSRSKDDPEAQAVRDHRELSIFLRAEVNALTSLLIKKGVFTNEEFCEQLVEEAMHLDLQYEQKFPGMSSTHNGIILSMPDVANTMKGWKP